MLFVFLSEIGNLKVTSITILVLLGSLYYFYDLTIFSVIIANPMFSAFIALLFIAIGIVYALTFKQRDFLRELAPNINDSYEIFIKNNKIPDDDEAKEKFLDSAVYACNYSVSANSGVYMNWVLLWPASLAWDLTYRPITAVWNFVGDILENFSKKYVLSILKKTIINDK